MDIFESTQIQGLWLGFIRTSRILDSCLSLLLNRFRLVGGRSRLRRLRVAGAIGFDQIEVLTAG